MDVLEVISDLQLNHLPRNWVDSLWSSDFEEEKEIPKEYDLDLDKYVRLINNLANAIDGWGKKDGDGSLQEISNDIYKKSWNTLIKNQVNFKALLSLINAFIRTDTKEVRKHKRDSAFSSARVYFALLSIPGSIACNIFNENLYECALKTFANFSCLLTKKSQKKSKAKKKKSDNEHVPDDSGELTVEELPEVEQREIIGQLCVMLDGLSNCLKELKLKFEEDSLELTVQILVKLSQLECGINVYNNALKPNSMGMVVLKSYNVLEQLCNSEHGETEKTIKLIMRFYIPTLVINEVNIKIPVKSNVPTNENTIAFIGRLLSNFKENALYGVKVVIQQLCVRMPDKADMRAKAIPIIIQLLELLPYKVFEGMMQWIVSLSHSDSVKYRICAIELISRLMNASDLPESSTAAENSPTKHHNVVDISINYGTDTCKNKDQIKLLYKFLLAAILSRSLDSSPVLRSKCLGIFGSLVLCKQNEIRELMQEIFVTPYYDFKLTVAKCNEEYFDFQKYFSSDPSQLLLPQNPLPSGLCIMQRVQSFSKDEKVFVRKNALLLMSNVCQLNKYWLSSRRLEILVASCRDVSLMIRKLVVKCLTDVLLMYPSNEALVKAWVQGVVPLIADSDMKCQEKVIESVKNVILDNLTTYEKTDSPHMKLPWIVLSAIAIAEKRILFKFACRTWSINKSVTKKTFKSLQSHIGTENNFAAWFFIVCLTEFEDFPSPRVLADYFFKNVYSRQADESLSQLVVEAIFLNWKDFDSQTQCELYNKLRSSIETFSVPLSLISRYLDICFLADKNETKCCCGLLVQLCEEFLKNYIASGCSSGIPGDICCYLHTLGDAAHFYPGVSMDILDCLAKIIDPTWIIPSMENAGCLQGRNGRLKVSVNGVIKAVAIVALGKVCLQDHFIAKKYATVFARVLNEDSATPMKINAMAALSDLCVRFTSVVEDNLGDMCVMLKDHDVQVRTHSLKLILQLIQEDYLKPKGALFFYLLIILRDPVNSVREIIEAFFTNVLLKRNPSIMCHYFIQALFFFNDYQGSGSYNKRKLSAKEKRIFAMNGVTNFHDRGEIYKFMLLNMRDDHRFKLSNRICSDILDEVNDHKISLDRKGVTVLKDALFALACDEMRLENLRKVDDDSIDKETDDVDIGGGEAVLGIAKKVFISQIVKANYVECIVPTISKLKKILSKLKSPLVRDLMICLRELMKDFKNEINDILHSDPELAAEVSLDLKDRSHEEDGLSDQFCDLNIKEVRAQCQQLSEKALCEKIGIVMPQRKPLRSPQSLSFLRPSSNLVTEIQLPSSIQCSSPIQQPPMQFSRKRQSSDGYARSGSSSSLSSPRSVEDSSSEIHHCDSQSLSPSFGSAGDERTVLEKDSFSFEGASNSVSGMKRSSDETFSSTPRETERSGRSNKSRKNRAHKKKK